MIILIKKKNLFRFIVVVLVIVLSLLIYKVVRNASCIKMQQYDKAYVTLVIEEQVKSGVTCSPYFI